MAELSKREHTENETPNGSTAKLILVAEDEPAVRSLLQRLLKMWGYRTLVAHNGREALEVADHHPGRIDLLLSDITMPEMGGQELAEKLTQQRPGIRVILMSGFSHIHLVVQYGWKFLRKPFKPAEVKEMIKQSFYF